METREVLRTPDARFADLPAFPYPPHHLEVPDERFGRLRMAYIDEGPRSAPPVLMLHGMPTWSFLYRKLIGPVSAAGFRVVAPDYIGFGRSDKPADRTYYTYARHVAWTRALIEALDLRQIALVCQDWGGPIGLRILSEAPRRFGAVVATNTLLPIFDPPPAGIGEWPGAAIRAWGESTRDLTDIDVSGHVFGADPAAARGYDAPFPDARYKAAVLQFPALIPIRPDMAGVEENRRAWAVLEGFERPFLTAFSDGDPFTKPWEAVFRRRVPGARGQAHTEIQGAGHFLQEERGEVLAEVVLSFLRAVHGGGQLSCKF
jgi:haloalkane dehalogenase